MRGKRACYKKKFAKEHKQAVLSEPIRARAVSRWLPLTTVVLVFQTAVLSLRGPGHWFISYYRENIFGEGSAGPLGVAGPFVVSCSVYRSSIKTGKWNPVTN